MSLQLEFEQARAAALAHYRQRKLADALSAIDAATQLRPEMAEPWVLRGVILRALGRLDDASASMSKATRLDPNDAHAWYNLGIVLGEQGRFQAAVESYDRANAIQPNADSFVNRAGALINLKRAGEALEACDRALALHPGHLFALCNRALALAELKRNAEAVAAFDGVLSSAPDMAESWDNRGTVLHDMRRYGDAVESFDRATALDPGSVAAWSNRGRSLFSLQRFDEAHASFAKALTARQPETAQEWGAYAVALVGLKRHEDALRAYDKVLSLAPEAAGLWSRRAVTLHTLGRFDEALQSAARALDLQPGLADALEIRGRVLLETHRIEEGLASLRQAGENAPTADTSSEHKIRHDAEQRDYLAALGGHVSGARLKGPAVNPANADSVAKGWAENRPQVVVIDNLLTPEGLAALRAFCWGSPMWQRAYENGYLGAIPETGFAVPLLAQIAEELRTTFPTVIGAHGLRLLWGFKYDSRLRGINIHADQAAVNVNFWITPDEANLDPERGGLVVYDANAPADWEAEDYNGNDSRVWDFLKRTSAKPITIPYRANRAVIFDSDLFHETDAFTFKEGYLNRRINVTMLYGRRTFYGS